MEAPPALRTAPRPRAFADARVVGPQWAAVARSCDVRPGHVRGVPAWGERLAVWRASDGAVHALDARCPHLGADLAGGRVESRDGAEALVCPFHGWRFGADGGCTHAPGLAEGRRARALPTEECWGLVWAFNAAAPLWPLPDAPAVPLGAGDWRVVRPPTQTVRCHPHLVVGNGLDVSHFDALHGFDLTAEPVVTVTPPYRVRVEAQGRPRSAVLRRLLGPGDVRFSFETTGGHLAVADVEAPVRLRAVFTAQPAPEGCRTQVVLFLPRRAGALARAAAGLYALLHDDVAVLEGLRFRRAFTAADAPMAAFADVVDALPAGWGSGNAV